MTRVYPPCVYCGDRLLARERDHVIPLSRGGPDTPDNIAEACIACNRDKRAMLLYEWRASRLHRGLPWPPLASHATDPRHYSDRACGCTAPHTPHTFTADDGGYRAIYRCPKEGFVPVGWAVSSFFFTDCPCAFCVHTSAVEASL